MQCPRCQTTVLTEKDRDGITVDICSSCRGVWLDRGELEKLIARATRDLDEAAERGFERRDSRDSAPPPPPAPSRPRDRRDSTPPRGVRYDDEESHRRHRRKRGWLDSLGDIFD